MTSSHDNTAQPTFRSDNLEILPEEMADVVETLTTIKSELPYLECFKEIKRGVCVYRMMADCATGLLVVTTKRNVPIQPYKTSLYLHGYFHLIKDFHVLMHKHGPDNIMAVLDKIVVTAVPDEAPVSCH